MTRFDAPPDSCHHMRCLQERDHSIWKANRFLTVPFPFVPLPNGSGGLTGFDSPGLKYRYSNPGYIPAT